MPIFNLVKNCTYYWAFGAYVSYFVNHPLYTSPDPVYSLALFALAVVCQASNFRCVQSAGGSPKQRAPVPSYTVAQRLSDPSYDCDIISLRNWVASTATHASCACHAHSLCRPLMRLLRGGHMCLSTQWQAAAAGQLGSPLVPHGRCHQILAELRPPGSKEYKIPRGFLFNYVTCANYTTEIIGWVAFTLATQTAAAAIFATCGALQMGQWAIQKHMRLRKVCCRR